ncbi:winged helix-turn-helix domain-containing protein [Halorussus halobius]|uniref:winged helix-turn-helix domain-containing protein n=1 Tax=Halorussus halobius TaxID=1710537 RepID=UPI001091FD83|nr:winged helix-turn-helix domain-containing protein [Halorussus halobius]
MSTPQIDENASEAAAEGTVLTDVLGPHAKVKILVALLSENDRDLNPTDVSRLAGIDRSTFYEHIDDLVAYGVVERTRTVGNSQMYRINRDNPAAEDLAQLEWDLLDCVPEA